MREDRYSLANFKIRFDPILKDRVAQPFEGSDEIGFDYEDEMVYLGASCGIRRIVFGTDDSRD